MKSIIIPVICSVLLLNACGSNPYIYKTSKNFSSEIGYSKKLDSVKIIKVIDKRPIKDSIIGFAITGLFSEKVPLVIENSLTNYIKNSFNSLISRDTTQTKFIPVTISINEFTSGVEFSTLNNFVFNKYSYTFEYPIDSTSKKGIEIYDSFRFQDKNPNDRLESSINLGIISASEKFIEKYKKDSIPTYPNKSNINAITNESKHSLIEVSNKKKTLSKLGGEIAFIRGNIVDEGINLTYYQMMKNIDSRIEYGLAGSIGIMNLKIPDNAPDDLGLTFGTKFLGRLNLSKNADDLFITQTVTTYLGFEIPGSDNFSLFGGPYLEESIGCFISQPLSISVGSYQFWFFGSEILTNDVGFFISFSLSTFY